MGSGNFSAGNSEKGLSHPASTGKKLLGNISIIIGRPGPEFPKGTPARFTSHGSTGIHGCGIASVRSSASQLIASKDRLLAALSEKVIGPAEKRAREQTGH